MNALVEQTEFGLTTNSRTVAEVFEKEHRNVLATIDDILAKQPDRCALNFQRTSATVKMPNGGAREVRAYEMDRDGFTLLAMGFTGEKALDWKLAYIEAFNRMEATLNEVAAPAEALPQDLQDFAPALSLMRETRLIWGKAAARRMWPQLGLPEVVRDDDVRFELTAGHALPETIAAWLEECTVADRGTVTGSTPLFQSYCRWCSSNGEEPESQTRFGRALTHMGYNVRKSANGLSMRKGIKLAA